MKRGIVRIVSFIVVAFVFQLIAVVLAGIVPLDKKVLVVGNGHRIEAQLRYSSGIANVVPIVGWAFLFVDNREFHIICDNYRYIEEVEDDGEIGFSGISAMENEGVIYVKADTVDVRQGVICKFFVD